MIIKIKDRGKIQEINLQCVIDEKEVTNKIIDEYNYPIPYNKFIELARKSMRLCECKEKAGHEIELFYAVGGSLYNKPSLIVLSDHQCPFEIQVQDIKQEVIKEEKKSFMQKLIDCMV